MRVLSHGILAKGRGGPSGTSRFLNTHAAANVAPKVHWLRYKPSLEWPSPALSTPPRVGAPATGPERGAREARASEPDHANALASAMGRAARTRRPTTSRSSSSSRRARRLRGAGPKGRGRGRTASRGEAGSDCAPGYDERRDRRARAFETLAEPAANGEAHNSRILGFINFARVSALTTRRTRRRPFGLFPSAHMWGFAQCEEA